MNGVMSVTSRLTQKDHHVMLCALSPSAGADGSGALEEGRDITRKEPGSLIDQVEECLSVRNT